MTQPTDPHANGSPSPLGLKRSLTFRTAIIGACFVLLGIPYLVLVAVLLAATSIDSESWLLFAGVAAPGVVVAGVFAWRFRRHRTEVLTFLILAAAIVLFVAVTLPTGDIPRHVANENATISVLRMIVAAEYTYSVNESPDVDGDGIADFGTLVDLVRTGNLDAKYGSGEAHGYRFSVALVSSDGNEPFFSVVAVPMEPDKSGMRSFSADETGAIRYEPDGSVPGIASSVVQ